MWDFSSRPVATPANTEAQLSFSRSQVHACLQALSVPAFGRVPEDLRFLLPPSIRPSLLVFYRYSSPRTPLIAHVPRQLVTGGIFVSERSVPTSDSASAQLADSDLHSSTLLTAYTFVLSRSTQPTFSHLLSLFRYFSAGHSCIHTHTSKLTCAISQTWRDCSCG